MKKETLIWLILVIATIFSFMFAESIGAWRIAASAALLIGALKVRLIFIHFMELKWGLTPFRIICEIWVIAAITVILGGYYYSEFMM